jgi:N-acetyl-gamma-glutamyl-phosphate reductase
VGASGYGGAETARLLLRHPRFELVAATARRAAGRRLADVHEFLEGSTDLVLSDEAPESISPRVAAMVFALPHGEAARSMQATLTAAPDLRVVDLSGDFRLDDVALWEKSYGMPHPAPALCGRFVYGLTEAHRADIAGARLVANPGCFATAMDLALFPLATRGMLSGEVVIFGATGSSGSGAEPSAGTHHPERAADFRAYKVLDHQHVPEVERFLRESGAADPRISFVPHSAPMVRGIFLTATLRMQPAPDGEALEALVREVYTGEPFVRVRRGTPRVTVVAGTNYCDLSVQTVDGRTVILAALDNLGKGMASQAVQNLNLMFGLPETAGLLHTGSRP